MTAGRVFVAALGAMLVVLPVASFAQPASAPPPSAAGADRDFLVGLRRVGVVAGQYVACTPDQSRPEQISKMSDIGMDLAEEYGIRAAFNFVGAAGYGSGLPLDQAKCPSIVERWTAIEKKYGAK